MSELNLNKATTTNIAGTITNYSVNAKGTDTYSDTEETFYYFNDASQNLKYYRTLAILKQSIDTLAIWTIGLGFKIDAGLTKAEQSFIKGWGEDSFSAILFNMIITKKIVGDAFAEIIREDGQLVNLKPISPERMRVVVGSNGLIKRYEQLDISRKNAIKTFEPSKIFHLCNDRVVDTIHGESILTSCKWALDALHEALQDNRDIKHRDRALGIAYYKTDDSGEISYANSQVEQAVKKGEMIGIPADTMEIKEMPNLSKSTADRLSWIQYLEELVFISVGVPRVMVTSQNYTEAGSKVGFLTFEPRYSWEQQQLELDCWNQLGIKLKCNRPPSLMSKEQESESKNTGQTSFQPKEASMAPSQSMRE